MASELSRVLEQVEKDKGIDRAVLIEALESAMVMAAKRKFGLDHEIEAQFNEELGEIELFEFKTVVDEVSDPVREVKQDQAQKMDPDVALGDSIGMKLDSSDFGRIAAQTAKQVIIQKVRDAERDMIYNEFNIRKGGIVHGTCRRVEKGCVIVDLGRTDAIMPAREQIPGESYRPGERVLGHLLDVQQTNRGPKIILSRTCPELLVQLFQQEVPEVNEGIVVIKNAAREPGLRAKIAVASTDSDVDPVGACVGVKGSRVQNVVQELRGEKIDIVPWDPEETRFVCNALAPAEIQKVLLDEAGHAMEIVVADSQLSLAIGKRGQNVKLASKLTGWRLDIVSESKMIARTEHARSQLLKVPGVSETQAQALYQQGFTVDQILIASAEEIAEVPGYDAAKATELKVALKAAVDSGAIDPTAQPAEVDDKRKMSSDAVFERLKAEVKAHEARASAEEVTEAAEAAAATAATEAAAAEAKEKSEPAVGETKEEDKAE